MDLHIWLAMLLASLIISVSPGAGAITTMNSSLNYGFIRTYAAILGLQVGFFAQILIVAVGLGGIIVASESLYQAIKWGGVLYLIYLGIMKIREGGAIIKGQKHLPQFRFRRTFLQAALVNLTNPKATVFLIAFMPQFLDPTKPQFIQLAIICATLIAVDVAVMSGYNFLSFSIRRWTKEPKIMRLQNRISGALLIGAAIFLSQSDNMIKETK